MRRRQNAPDGGPAEFHFAGLEGEGQGELPRSTRLVSIRAGFGQSGQAVVAYIFTMILPCSVAAIAQAGCKAHAVPLGPKVVG